MEQNKQRIESLDGLRVVAIMMVMMYHFYTCFTNLISYSIKFPKVFHYGYLGVELFFIISGFVITLTLTKCNSMLEFVKKRFLRLIPGMIVCSTITFVLFNLFDNNNILSQSKSILNLLFSNTFINPYLVNKIFGLNLQYIDNVYWSLFVELQFYFLAATVYFYSPKKFFKNIIVICFVLFLFYLLTTNKILFTGKFLWISIVSLGFFELPRYISWFLIGIVINQIYFDNKDKRKLIFLLFLFLIQIILSVDIYIKLFVIFCMFIFLSFLYYPKILKLLSNNHIKKVGVSSYSIYLIHENIGILIINKFSIFFGSLNWILPILLMFLFSIFGVLSYKYLEYPIGVKLKQLFKI